MLDVFRGKLAQNSDLSDRVELIHGNMANFSIDRKFELIISPFRAFQALIHDRDIENSLCCIREHLSKTGIFIINVFRPYAVLDESWCRKEELDFDVFDEKSKIRLRRFSCRDKIDTVNQIIFPYFVFEVVHPDSKIEHITEHLELKYFYKEQLRAFIENAGLEIVEEYSWYDKSPPDGKEIIFVCKKA